MQKLTIFQIDAFTDQLFEGNPAAVIPLEEWLPKTQMQQIATENNLSETAFFVRVGSKFGLKWFTPVTEVDLCGHATLSAAHVMFNHMAYKKERIMFMTNSGELQAWKEGNKIFIDMPVNPVQRMEPPRGLFEALGILDVEYVGFNGDYLIAIKSERDLEKLKPDMSKLNAVECRGVIVTAPAKGNSEFDFVSRFFAPSVGVNEDPVTGSAHTALIPFWAAKLDKDELTARQISARGGTLHCRLRDDRVEIGGDCVSYMKGTIILPE
jgi:predicted PhzF superfamily epimerase YddE/YHI9